MLYVLGCIFQQHDLRLVLLAAGLCVLASATALAMILRARAAGKGRTELFWLGGAGAVAGCGIWATHFVAMLAYHSGLPIGFDTDLTILSVVIAMGLCAVGFLLAVRFNGAAGGLVTGSAIAAMHYTGMAAVVIPAYAVWDTSYVAASVLVAVPLSGLALHVAVRRRRRADPVLAAGLFVLAIVGLHFTGMSAVHFVPDGSVVAGGNTMDPFALAAVVAASAAFIVMQGLMMALIDRYLSAKAVGEAARMRAHIDELEVAQEALLQTSADLSVALDAAAAASRAKSSFLASMSHELRTPLNAVIGFSETMALEVFGPLGPRYKDYANDIRNSGAHLLSLINDILDLTRLDAGELALTEEEFDPALLVEEALRMVAGQAERGAIHLSTAIAPSLPLLRADRRRIKQIVLNLVANAVKFTPAGGRVQVRADLLMAGPAPDGLVLAVCDTGIGIAAEDIPKALAHFGQVDSSLARKYEGTGLGLPLSQQLAALHGGSLALESTLEVGTTVTVTLPAARLVPRRRTAAA